MIFIKLYPRKSLALFLFIILVFLEKNNLFLAKSDSTRGSIILRVFALLFSSYLRNILFLFYNFSFFFLTSYYSLLLQDKVSIITKEKKSIFPKFIIQRLNYYLGLSKKNVHSRFPKFYSKSRPLRFLISHYTLHTRRKKLFLMIILTIKKKKNLHSIKKNRYIRTTSIT